MKLLAHHTLNGFGGMGEGMSMQLARDGRRVLWLAHESAPKNFTAVDESDPRAPKVIVQTDLPHAQMRSNSLEVAGDLMAVAYQVTKFGLNIFEAGYSNASIAGIVLVGLGGGIGLQVARKWRAARKKDK